MIGYSLWVAFGIALAAGAARWQGASVALPGRQRAGLMLCAIGGAVLGAHGLQLPADFFGWSAPPPLGLEVTDALPLGGRTVLGGLLGGWLAVEWGKRRVGIRTATGDAFALPLALALGCGRMGCAAAGCCAGRVCEPNWWAWTDRSGVSHLPVQWVEVLFHFAMAAWLLRALRTGRAAGRRLAIQLSLYAVLRFLLEFARQHPPVLAGLSYHQLLALGLLALAGGTWWRRAHAAARLAMAGGAG